MKLPVELMSRLSTVADPPPIENAPNARSSASATNVPPVMPITPIASPNAPTDTVVDAVIDPLSRVSDPGSPPAPSCSRSHTAPAWVMVTIPVTCAGVPAVGTPALQLAAVSQSPPEASHEVVPPMGAALTILVNTSWNPTSQIGRVGMVLILEEWWGVVAIVDDD